MTREEKLLILYKSCLENDFTDMSNETHQLKAKVFAMDLKLKYKDIRVLYNEAKELHEQAERIKAEEAVVGDKILTLIDNEKNNYYIYKRPNGSVYCRRNNTNKKCSFSFEASRKQVLNSTYHPSQTVYTGASSGGVSMGGFHQTKGYYTESLSSTDKGEMFLVFEDERILLNEITVSTETGFLFKNDACFKSRFVGNTAQCRHRPDKFQNQMYSSTMSGGYADLSMASYLTSQMCLEFSVCQELVAFLYRVCNGEIPEQDEDIYIRAKKLAESGKKIDLITSKELFQEIRFYKDSTTHIINLSEKIAEVEKKEKEQIQLEKEQLVLKKEAQTRRNKKLATIITPIVAVLLVFIIVLTTVIIPNNKYNEAVVLMEDGKYEEALKIFNQIPDYKDVESRMESCYNAKYGTEVWSQIKNLDVGDTYIFGSYEQDNNTTNGKEELEWRILEKKDNKILVISQYAIDCMNYNPSNNGVTWENCVIRDWLNSDFIDSAFTDAEKAMIPTVTVKADRNPNNNTNPGRNTQDKVFLLSVAEANKYLAGDRVRKCTATDFATDRGAYESDNGKCYWWLRTPGRKQDRAAAVDWRGVVREAGVVERNGDEGAVRPAMWIEF